MNTYLKIKDKLESNLNINKLEIIDESHLHKGHVGYSDEGESHFRIKISSDNFKGLSRVNQHKIIYNILADEMKNKIHALAIEIK